MRINLNGEYHQLEFCRCYGNYIISIIRKKKMKNTVIDLVNMGKESEISKNKN